MVKMVEFMVKISYYWVNSWLKLIVQLMPVELIVQLWLIDG